MTVYRAVLNRLLSGQINEEEIEEKEQENIKLWREANDI